MVILGVVLLILGLLLGVHLLVVLGLVLIVLGLVLNLVPLGGSRHRWY